MQKNHISALLNNILKCHGDKQAHTQYRNMGKHEDKEIIKIKKYQHNIMDASAPKSLVRRTANRLL